MKIIIALIILLISFQASAENIFYYKTIDTHSGSINDIVPYEYTFNDTDFTWHYGDVFNNIGAIDISISNLDGSEALPGFPISFRLMGPDGRFSSPGTYSHQRYPFQEPGYAGADTDWDSCNRSMGEIKVYEVSYDVDGNLTSIAADWKTSCTNAYLFNHYKLRLNTDFPLNPPTIHAITQEKITASIGQLITLDASSSYSDDASISNYNWKQVAGQTVTLTNSDTAQAEFTVPDNTNRESFDLYEFELTVVDTNNRTETARSRVIVTQNISNGLSISFKERGRNFWWVNEPYKDSDLSNYDLIRRNGNSVFLDPLSGGSTIMSLSSPFFEDINIGNNTNGDHTVFKGDHNAGVGSDWCTWFSDVDIRDRLFNTVHDIEYGANAEIVSLAADMNYCHPSNAWVYDMKIRYNSPAPLEFDYPKSVSPKNVYALAGERVFLNGVNSYSDKSSIVDYKWSQVSGPNVEIHSSDTPFMYFDTNKTMGSDNEYEFTLTVTDKNGVKDTSKTKVLVKSLSSKNTYILQKADFGEYVSSGGYGYHDIAYNKRDMALRVTNDLYPDWESPTEYINLWGNAGYNNWAISLKLPIINDSPIESGSYESVPGDDVTDPEDPNAIVPQITFNAARGSRGCSSSTSDINILKIDRDEKGNVVELAIDFTQKCDSLETPLEGFIRYNSGIPSYDYNLNVEMPQLIKVAEGGNISITPTINLDEPAYVKWTQIYGPQPWPSRNYDPELHVVAPTVMPNKNEHLGYRVEVFTESGKFGKSYVAVEIEDNGIDIFDHFEIDATKDKPAVYVDNNGSYYGVRNVHFGEPFLRFNPINEDINGIMVGDKVVTQQISPVFESETYESRLLELEIVSKWKLDDGYEVIEKYRNGNWYIRKPFSNNGLRVENGWNIVLTTNRNGSIDLPPESDNDLDLGDTYFKSQFAIVKLETNSGGGTTPAPAPTPTPPPSGGGGGGGSTSLLMLLMMLAFAGRRYYR